MKKDLRKFVLVFLAYGIACASGCDHETVMTERDIETNLQAEDNSTNNDLSTEASKEEVRPDGTKETSDGNEQTNDPVEALLARLDNAALKSQYPSIRDAAADPDASPNELYRHLSVLAAAGSALAEASERENAFQLFEHAYEHCEEVRRRLGGEHLEPAQELVASLYYNGACAMAQNGDLSSALTALGQAVQNGFADTTLLATDTDLDPLRQRDDFAESIKLWHAQIQAAKSFPFDFNITDLDGNNLSLEKLKGKVLIVDIWGTWCPPCRAEIPHFVKLQETYGDQGLQIIGINYERTEDIEEATQMINEFRSAEQMNYPCAIGTDEIKAQVPNFRGFPTTIFIDRDGRVQDMLVGLQDYELLEDKVKSLLEHAPALPESGE